MDAARIWQGPGYGGMTIHRRSVTMTETCELIVNARRRLAARNHNTIVVPSDGIGLGLRRAPARDKP